MTAAALDLRGTSDEELLSLYRSDEDAAAAALAEAARRDRTDRAAAARAAIRAEWYDAAYVQFLQAEAVCCGNLLSREGLAAGITDPFSLWHGPRDVAMKYASEELRDLWAVSPRVTITEYEHQRAAAMRAAREDTGTDTDEGTTDEQRDMAADRRPGLDADAGQRLQPGSGTRADEPIRADRGAREAGPRAATGPIQRGEQPMSVLQGIRVAEHMARAVAGSNDANQRQTVPPRVRQAGTVAVPASQAPVRPPAKPVDGGLILKLADRWMCEHTWMSPAARHTVVLYVAAQHFRLSDDARTLAWPRAFGRVMLLADKPGSGKTTTMTLMGYLAAPFYAANDSNPTARGLGYRIKDQHVMLCIDEVHRLFGPKGTRRPDVVTILNSGYERNGSTVDGRGGKANELRTYGAAVMAGKSDIRKSGAEELSDLLDRCVAVIDMEQPPDDVELAELDEEAEADGRKLAAALAQWAAQEMANPERFREAYKVACDAAKEDGLRGRAKDIWVPLLATAWLAGPDFLLSARDAAVEFQLNRPVQREDPEQPDEVADPLAGLEARLTGGADIPSWG